jgi:hypothetical protein
VDCWKEVLTVVREEIGQVMDSMSNQVKEFEIQAKDIF